MSDFSYFEETSEQPTAPGRLVEIAAELPAAELGPGLLARVLLGEQSMASFVRWQPNTEAPRHAHAEEQIFVVLEGELEIDLGGEVRLMGPGEAALIPAWTQHSVRSFDGPAYQIDFFAPPRQALLKLMERASS